MQYEPKPGQTLYNAIIGAIANANFHQVEVNLTFNGTSVRVYPSSHEYDISEKYYYKRKYEQLSKYF